MIPALCRPLCVASEGVLNGALPAEAVICESLESVILSTFESSFRQKPESTFLASRFPAYAEVTLFKGSYVDQPNCMTGGIPDCQNKVSRVLEVQSKDWRRFRLVLEYTPIKNGRQIPYVQTELTFHGD